MRAPVARKDTECGMIFLKLLVDRQTTASYGQVPEHVPMKDAPKQDGAGSSAPRTGRLKTQGHMNEGGMAPVNQDERDMQMILVSGLR